MTPSRLGLKEIYVHFGVFDFAFYCLVGPYDNVEKYVRWKFEDDETPITTGSQANYAPRGRFFYRPGYCPIIWIPRNPRTPREYGTLAHEVSHLVIRLMDWADIPLGPDSEEAYTHAIGFAVTKILEGVK